MRRNSRMKNSHDESFRNKIIISGGIALIILAAIIFTFIMYGNELSGNVQESRLSSEQIANLISNENQNSTTESASSTIGKSIEEAEKTENSTTTNTTDNKSNNTTTQKKTTTKKQTSTTSTKTTNSAENATATSAKAKEETKKELSFIQPVEGEIIKEFAKENLVYSETLKEWVTHNGIDIKADKTSVVKAAEDGTIKTIKNDPRYGLTVVIEHTDGMQTIYSNLLTAEFVVEGENVTKGQTIGTVGNTAVFEISDDCHLHFEIWKDQVAVNPTNYIKSNS